MKYIPPGTFLMGSPKTETGRGYDENQHSVTLTRGFWLLEHPVTQKAWETIMGNNPSCFKLSPNHPVERVSWEDVQKFIQKLNARDGVQYRLPTEAEWEYAARGGQNHIYSGSNHIEDVAWYSGNSGSQTHPVCQKRPNAFGLYDMSGNVWEWVQDWYGPYATAGNTFNADSCEDPQGNLTGSYRVLRGGGWNYFPVYSRSAVRIRDTPGSRNSYLGFRLARSAFP